MCKQALWWKVEERRSVWNGHSIVHRVSIGQWLMRQYYQHLLADTHCLSILLIRAVNIFISDLRHNCLNFYQSWAMSVCARVTWPLTWVVIVHFQGRGQWERQHCLHLFPSMNQTAQHPNATLPPPLTLSWQIKRPLFQGTKHLGVPHLSCYLDNQSFKGLPSKPLTTSFIG